MTTDITSKIIGTWRLVSCMAQGSDGQVSYPYGKNAQGRAHLEPGRFAFQRPVAQIIFEKITSTIYKIGNDSFLENRS